MRKKHKMQHLTKNDINEIKRIQQTTTCNYSKKGNANDMSINYNVTVARHGDDTALEHWRVDLGTHHYNRNLKKEYIKKYGNINK